MTVPRDWIVITGGLVDSVDGSGGFEFFGPFTQDQAEQVRKELCDLENLEKGRMVMAVQLIKSFNRARGWAV